MSLWGGCWLMIATAGVFELPLALENGPPPQLPALMRYEPPTFPDSLRFTSITDGFATMMFTIDADGRVQDSVPIEASHPAFVESMRTVFKQWRFEPAPSATTPRRETIQFDFRRTGTISSLSQRDASKSAFPTEPAEHERPIRTVERSDLTAPLERLHGEMPAYPADLRTRLEQGFARIDFVVDTKGAVRVPVIVEATSPALGESALQAIKRWQFAPPRVADENVNVRLVLAFNFGRQQTK